MELPGLPYEEATPFVLDGQLLMFVQEECHKDFIVVASDDKGETWSDPRTVIEGPIWNISTSRVLRPDALYWAMDYDLPGHGHGGKTMLRMDRSMSPLDPGAWTLSNIVRQPEIPRCDAAKPLPRRQPPAAVRRLERPSRVAGAQHRLKSAAGSALSAAAFSTSTRPPTLQRYSTTIPMRTN